MKNTKMFILSAAICCLGIRSNAQTTFGPVVGLNMATVSGSDAEDNEMLSGFHAGLLVDLKAGTNFVFETGLSYSQKGVQYKQDNELKYKSAYLVIPFMPKYIANSGFNFFMGPYVGFLLSSKVTYGSDEADVMDATHTFAAGMKFGVGYQLASGFGISANYEYGVTNVLKDIGTTSHN